ETRKLASSQEGRAPEESHGRNEQQRLKTFEKFKGVYGDGVYVESLFEYAIIGFRLDRMSEEYATELTNLNGHFSENPEEVFSVLRGGQLNLPSDWGAVRNTLTNLAMSLDVDSSKKVEYL